MRPLLAGIGAVPLAAANAVAPPTGVRRDGQAVIVLGAKGGLDAPAAMLPSSNFFMQGEALVAGGFVPVPGIIRIGARLTLEGGREVPFPVG